MLTWGRHYWPWFLIISAVWILLAFGIPEAIALITKIATHTDNTLSNYSRTELNVSTQMTIHTVAWYLSLIVWLGFAIWATGHIWFDLWG